ncbi:MAG: ABC transporter ATP-binding protein [Armatimonadetes bacterium]|nr:ABC transporter ATP-binding protein [Armatimonadota bacterium]
MAPDAPSRGAEVEVRAITKRFGAVVAVRSVSFVIRGGEFFSLLGPSGCGKTTTLRVIGGFEHADEGEVAIGGTPMGRTPPNRRPTNMVFQRLALFPHYTVFENVAFGLRMKRLPEEEIRQRVGEALELVQMPGLAGRKISELSGGQQQRVALARALVNRPRVLLLDEPLSSLDLKLRLQMQEELKRLQRELGTTFVSVTHDPGEALAMSDRVGVMDSGILHQVGAPMEIYERPRNRFVANFIGDANLIDGVVQGTDGDTVAVRAGGVVVRARRAGWEQIGQTLTVCVRPERIQIGAAADLPNAFRGRVEDWAFSGSMVKYRLAAGPVRLHAAVPYLNGAPLFQVGEEVAAGWDPMQAVLVPTEAAAPGAGGGP